ncbi:per os infectivity factor 3 [Drosophila suzukii associated hytrosavirus 1]|nr:per os infectivity factor 3 [Drosophila suzukii associated hytrosavirus 1]
MEILFIIYLLLLLSLILYLIIFEYYNRNVREKLKNNTTTTTSITTANDQLNRINCQDKKIYCTNNTDCIQMCSHTINDELQVQYKCSEINVCTQSLLTTEEETNINPNSCNRQYGFFPILTADEFFQPHWICLNTKPYLFNDKQQFHSYICAGGTKNINPQNVFDTCICSDDQIKVRDEFRNGIPLCIDKHLLPLFPNFSK